ncbi:Ku protein [soil metagenome]
MGMPRPVWTGSISFGMVSIPVRLAPAVRRSSISFNQLDRETMSRIRYRKVSEQTGEEVPADQIVKAAPVGADRYVVVSDDELAAVQPARSKEIDLEGFVPAESIPPAMFDSTYHVLPDGTAKPYALLAKAIADADRVGIGRFVMRNKAYIAAIRSDGQHLQLSTLVFPEELVEAEHLEEFSELNGVELADKELTMATSLVEAMSGDFEPERYQDDHRVALQQLIDAKAAGNDVSVSRETDEPAAVIDLAEALERSLAAAGKAKGRHPSSQASSGTASGTKRATPKKNAAARKSAARAKKSA